LERSNLQFFEELGHKRIQSASLLPENDPSVLFTTAGMHRWCPSYSARLTRSAAAGQLPEMPAH